MVELAAFWYAELFVNPNSISASGLVDAAVAALISAGLSYRDTRVGLRGEEVVETINYLDPEEIRPLALEEAKALAVRYLETQLGNRSEMPPSPPDLRFLHRFRYEPQAHARWEALEGLKDKRAPDTIELSFLCGLDEKYGTRYEIWFDCWDHFDFGAKHAQMGHDNKADVIRFFESLVAAVPAYYGWMSDEARSFDMSYGSVLKQELPCENEFVYVGAKLGAYLSDSLLERLKGEWKRLPDGSVFLHCQVSIRSFGEDELFFGPPHS